MAGRLLGTFVKLWPLAFSRQISLLITLKIWVSIIDCKILLIYFVCNFKYEKFHFLIRIHTSMLCLPPSTRDAAYKMQCMWQVSPRAENYS